MEQIACVLADVSYFLCCKRKGMKEMKQRSRITLNGTNFA